MTLLWWLIALAALLALVYALWLRPWLKTRPWAQRFFTAIEPLELALFKKSETILVGRLLWVGGLLVTLYDAVATFAGSLDLTPITTRLLDAMHIPQDLRGLTVTAFIAALGRIITWLRTQTTKPLELVAVPEDAVTPAAAAAMAQADVAKEQAVRVVNAEVHP